MATGLWSLKYAPQSLKEVAGNEDAKEQIRKWALEAERGKAVQPLLIYGPVGVGKSALAMALAREMGWNVLETNASDLRDAETLKKIYGISSSSGSLLGGKQMILIDEIDSVSDRQEFSTLQQIMKISTQPIILIANDLWNQKLTAIRFSCKKVEMKKVNAASIRKRLGDIEKEEGVADGEVAEMIAKTASGDIRGAINDLQAVSGAGSFEFERMGRERDENIFEAVRTVFKTLQYKHALEAGGDYNTQEFDMFMKWLEENIPLEYEKIEEQAEAFNWLSRADIFKGRIMRRQHWRYLKYVNSLSAAGVALSKKEIYHKFTRYQFPSGIRALSQSKKKRGLLKSIYKKVASKLHISISDAKLAMSMLIGVQGFEEYFGFSDEESSVASELYKHEKHQQRKRRKQDNR